MATYTSNYNANGSYAPEDRVHHNKAKAIKSARDSAKGNCQCGNSAIWSVYCDSDQVACGTVYVSMQGNVSYTRLV